jgi:glycosyltransferase involved in cell wall biosynthesis
MALNRLRTVAAFHLREPSGPLRTLTPVLRRLAAAGELVIALPERGLASAELDGVGRVELTGHAPLVLPRTLTDLFRLPGVVRRDVARFRAILRAHRADLALIATTTLPALTLAARLERVATVVYAAELYRQGAPGDRLRQAGGHALVRLNHWLASVTVTPSARVAAQHGGGAVVAHPAIDPAVAVGDADAFRTEHRLPSGGPWLATLGSISPGRGQDTAIRALAVVRRRHPDARLIIAGVPHPRPVDRAFEAELRSLAGELDVRDAVHHVGFVRPGDLFAVCDLLLNPARVAESFGRAALEALVAGRPVVSTAVGAVPDVLADGEHALLVPADRPDALAAAVERLLGDPTLARRLADRGRAHVLSSFSVEQQLERFDEAISMALERAAR